MLIPSWGPDFVPDYLQVPLNAGAPQSADFWKTHQNFNRYSRTLLGDLWFTMVICVLKKDFLSYL